MLCETSASKRLADIVEAAADVLHMTRCGHQGWSGCQFKGQADQRFLTPHDATVPADFTVWNVELEFVRNTKPTVYLECRARCGNVSQNAFDCPAVELNRSAFQNPPSLCRSSFHSVGLSQNSNKRANCDT